MWLGRLQPLEPVELERWFEGLEELEQKEREEQPARVSEHKFRARLGRAIAFICVGGFLVPYILARLFLLVEIFRTLGFLPPHAFVDTWSGSLPHFG